MIAPIGPSSLSQFQQPRAQQPVGNHFDFVAATGLSPVGMNGSKLEDAAQFAVNMREAIAAADQQIRSVQVR